MARRVLTLTCWRRPARSSHRSDTARPTAARLAAAAEPMRKGVGRMGSRPPVNSTSPKVWGFRKGMALRAKRVKSVIGEELLEWGYQEKYQGDYILGGNSMAVPGRLIFVPRRGTRRIYYFCLKTSHFVSFHQEMRQTTGSGWVETSPAARPSPVMGEGENIVFRGYLGGFWWILTHFGVSTAGGESLFSRTFSGIFHWSVIEVPAGGGTTGLEVGAWISAFAGTTGCRCDIHFGLRRNDEWPSTGRGDPSTSSG